MVKGGENMKIYKSTIPKLSLVREKSGIKKVKIKSSKDAYEYARQFYKEDIDIYESAFLLLLNRASNTMGWVKISQGGIGGTIMDVRIITKYAIDILCSAVILYHNHPSGDPQPSQEDINLTKTVKDGLKIFQIMLLDHIILTKEDHFSFADNGLI